MPLILGTSGWQYRHWRGRLYPHGVPQRRWLSHYAERFEAVEVNSTFYRLPTPAAVEGWADAAPDGFVFAVKASRYLTHIRRLREPREPVQRLMQLVEPLGDHLGPVLLQLPPQMPCDAPALAATLACFPTGVRVAVEPRDPTWFSAAVRGVLERHGAAYCLADRPGLRAPHWRTADWGYVRFHEGRATPRPCYGRSALTTWAERIAGLFDAGDDVFAFFNNDPEGCAPRDARVFAGLASTAGLAPTRVPGMRETPVGATAR